MFSFWPPNRNGNFKPIWPDPHWPTPPCTGFTCPVEVVGRLRVKKFAPTLGSGRERILSDPPRPAYIYKNAIRAFIFIPTYIYKNAIRVTHIYISLFSLQPPLSLSLFSICSSLTFSQKKILSRLCQPLTASSRRQPCQRSLSLPHAAASPANSLSLSPPHAAFTPTSPSRRHPPFIIDPTSICYMPALLQYQMSKKKYHKIYLQLIHVCEFFFFSYFNIEEIYVNVLVLFWCLILGYLFIFLVNIDWF